MGLDLATGRALSCGSLADPGEAGLAGEHDELGAIAEPSFVVARMTWVFAVRGSW
jgi:hypothetical protein